MFVINISFRQIVFSVMVFGGGLGTGFSQNIAPLKETRVPPTRDQALAVLRKTISTVKEAGYTKPALKYFHRAPGWGDKMLGARADLFLDSFFYDGEDGKDEFDTTAIEELARDGIWGPATGIIEKDRLRRRVVWHRVKTDACYALALKDGSTEAVFHLEGAKLTILHYEDEAKRKTIQGYLKDMLEENKSGDPSGTALSFGLLGDLGPDAEAVIPELSKLLTNKDSQKRIMAAFTLWRIDRRAETSLPSIIAGLTDNKMSASERTMAATCLWAIGPDAKSAAPALTAAMTEGDLMYRMTCASALWRVGGDTDAVRAVLLDVLKGADLYAASGAERTLADIISTLQKDPGRKAVAEQLTRQILELSSSKEVHLRKAAFNVLSQSGGDNPAVIEALTKALKDEDASIRDIAASAIESHNRSQLSNGGKVDDGPEESVSETNSKKVPNPYGVPDGKK